MYKESLHELRHPRRAWASAQRDQCAQVASLSGAIIGESRVACIGMRLSLSALDGKVQQMGEAEERNVGARFSVCAGSDGLDLGVFIHSCRCGLRWGVFAGLYFDDSEVFGKES